MRLSFDTKTTFSIRHETSAYLGAGNRRIDCQTFIIGNCMVYTICMPLLDELSGFEFEDTMALVLEKQGYEDVQVAEKVADLGRDIIMREPNDNGPDTAVIVECKHTEVVSRPVIQKLDSAVNTYDHDGSKRGMVATTGRVTDPGKEYAEAVDIEIIDGRKLREIADEVGMDIYNGRIEIICEEVLDPVHPAGPTGAVSSVIADIDNLEHGDLPDPETTLTMIPTVIAHLHVQRTFETNVGVIHTVDEEYTDIVDASRDGPKRLPTSVQSLIVTHFDRRVSMDEDRLTAVFDAVSTGRFGRTETEYQEWLTEQAIDRCTRTVRYTGKNNVTYERVCEPSSSDVSIVDFRAVFTPRIQAWYRMYGRDYVVDWFNAGDEYVVLEDTFHDCRVCEEGGAFAGVNDVRGILGAFSEGVHGSTYTCCSNCGRIACQKHIREERVTGDPICTACAVTDRVAGAKKYFFDEDNKSSFADEYAAMSLSEKMAENGYGLVFATICFVLVLFIILM